MKCCVCDKELKNNYRIVKDMVTEEGDRYRLCNRCYRYVMRLVGKGEKSNG